MSNPKLPGMPGPDPDTVKMHVAVKKAIQALYDALLPIIELLPGGDSKFQVRHTIKGTKVQVTVQPAEEEE
jgi:hypothetical protein